MESEKSLESESNSDLLEPRVEEAMLRERAQESLEALEITESSSSRVSPPFEKWKHFIVKESERVKKLEVGGTKPLRGKKEGSSRLQWSRWLQTRRLT